MRRAAGGGGGGLGCAMDSEGVPQLSAGDPTGEGEGVGDREVGKWR